MVPYMREQVSWHIDDDKIFASLDIPEDRNSRSALLIVSGGNEIRSGSHNSQSELAQYICNQGHYVLRFDRRGIGDSEGENRGYQDSEDDIVSALLYLRNRIGQHAQIRAFGNCDAASALLLNLDKLDITSLILANPWTHDPKKNDAADISIENNKNSMPSAAAIRARYWARLKNPRSIIELFSGKIDISKFIKGLLSASKREELSNLAKKLQHILSVTQVSVDILISNKDSTGMAFTAVYNSTDYREVRNNSKIVILELNSASHSFSDKEAKTWLYDRLAISMNPK